MAPAPKLLAVYLNDHLAGSVVGTNLARRLVKENEDNEYGREMAVVAREIEEDQGELERLMDRLEVHKRRARLGIAWVAEKFGRLKPNGRLVGYSPLSRLIELEGLMMGISGKLALWRALKRVEGSLPALRETNLERLIERAESQRATVQALRVEAAGEALTQD